MEAILAKWERLSVSSGALRFLDINLRSIGQVMFQNNPLTGILFLAAIAWGSYAAGFPRVAIAGVVAVVVANLTAQWLHVDNESLYSGLYGYNAVLVGLALATFLSPNALMWVYVVLGASVSVIAMLGTANALKPWGVSSLTFPFVLTTWLLLLATYGFSGLVGTALPSGNVVTAFQPYDSSPLKLIDLFQGVLQSISQVFLKASGVAALLLLAGLAVNSLAAAAFALAGAILAVLVAHLFGAESELITGGLLGFSPVLTAIALGTVFYRPSWRVAIYAMLGTLFTVIAQAALNVALTPFAIPALTAPFVLVTWIFLLPRQCFEPAAADAGDVVKARTT
ncbi:urea transporter [Bradyrhizobium neotropicale]|uniref:urea transporter n=1 Tax=Bradyrhizobium neotropicale TaxID=1497615 RepID=UPI001AD75BE3|nr:urea transporter [Bradyrhizobium neotropicale]MBO4224150.1 urea transporter [Bradyrhizobium neotropicale]